MNTTVYELKQYYVAAGGQAADVENISTIPDMIAAITALGGGSSGGGDSNIIVAHINRPDPYTTVCDMTVAEMEDALQSGKVVTLYDSLYGGWLTNMGIVYGETNSAAFVGIDPQIAAREDKVKVNLVSISADGTVTAKSYSLGA